MRRLGALLVLAAAMAWAQPSDRVERGRAIFARSCGIGYCHGKEGAAGRGPRLAGRKLDRRYLVKVISEGVSNSLMPAFKAQLGAEEIEAVVDYVLSLSAEGLTAGTRTPVTTAAENSRKTAASSPSEGDPERGRALFFDASNPKRCAACHRFRGRGAEVGPDLTAVSGRPQGEILQDILEPGARVAMESITVITKAGERLIGVKKQETRELLQIYDLGTLPPVLRTVYKDQVEAVTKEKRSLMPGDYGRTLSAAQLLDLVAFLRSEPPK